jgi:tRNA (guanine26-N2/guanine27-N2)-dimethyltransferase
MSTTNAGHGDGDGDGGDENYVEITEGKAKIWFPTANSVFYNPVQVFNRDLSIAVINHYSDKYWDVTTRHRQKQPFWKSSKKVEEPTANANTSTDETNNGLSILEALAASGLRSIRYALEIPRVGEVISNDLSEEAYQSMIRNIKINKVDHIVRPSCHDASLLMYQHKDPLKRFDIIDLDPYGSPAIFLDSTVQACHDGGLLCVTCTDTSVLCGNHSETCYAKYGSVSLKAKYCHEMALRIILASLDGCANRYRRYIHPLLSCSVDFYCRVFVTVYTSPAEVKRSASKTSMVYHCVGCGSYYLQPLGRCTSDVDKGSVKFTVSSGPPVDQKCEHCGCSFKFGGPVWSDPIHDVSFVESLLESVKKTKDNYSTSDRIIGLLSMICEELPDVPFYHLTDDLCSTLHCNSIKLVALRSAILRQGYRVSVSHTHANAIKTDAPHSVIWDIMRVWVRDNPVKGIKPSSPAGVILSKQPSLDVSFEVRSDANPPSRVFKLVRFPENPETNWGPKPRAKRKYKI